MGISLGGSRPIQTYASNPATGNPGQIIFNSTDKNYYGWNGLNWILLTEGALTGNNTGDNAINTLYDANSNSIVDNSEKLNNQSASYYLSRSNHTGTQLSSTISNLTSAIDSRINVSNILKVKSSNLLSGDFSSIKTACDSITTNGINNAFVIEVYPGTYVEDNFILKPYCYLKGLGGVIIEALDPTDTLITINDNTIISNVELTGANNLIGIAVSYSGLGTGSALIENCKFGNNYTQVVVAGTSGKSILEIQNCTMTNFYNFTKGFVISNTSGNETNVYIDNLFIEDNSAPYPNSIINIFGNNTNLFITNSKMLSGLSGTAIMLSDGAKVSLVSSVIEGFNEAIYNPNTGLPVELNIYSTIIKNSANNDLIIENNASTGSFTGMADNAKISNLANLFKIFLADKNSSQFYFLNDVNLNSKDLLNVGNINNIPAQLATQTTSGFLSAIDKTKIDNFSSTGSDAQYMHTQNTPQTTWNIAHMLGKKPSVRITNLSGETIYAYIMDIDDNNLQIQLGIATTGYVYCN